MKTIVLSAMLFLLMFTTKAQSTKSELSQKWNLATLVKTEYKDVNIPEDNGNMISSDTLHSSGGEYLTFNESSYTLSLSDYSENGKYVLTKNTVSIGKDVYTIEAINDKYLTLALAEYYPSTQTRVISKMFLYR